MSNSKFEVGSLWMDTRGGCVKILANDSPDPQNPVVGMNMQSYMIYRYNENGCGDWNLKSKWREPINASFYIAEDDQPEFQPENVDRLLANILDWSRYYSLDAVYNDGQLKPEHAVYKVTVERIYKK